MRVESQDQAVVQSPGDAEIDLGGIGAALVKHKMWVIGPTLLALAASTAFVNIVKPRYTAEARMLLESQDSFLPREKGSDTVTPQSIDPEAVGSQIQLVTSRDVARRAIKAIGLVGNPEFDPLAGGLGALSRVLILAGLKRDPTQLSPEDRVLETYYEKLTVFSPQKTRVLNIEFQARTPELAARGANTIAETYLEFQQEAKRDLARSAAATLGGLVADLKTRVAAAEARVEEFRMQSGLFVGSNNEGLLTQQLGDLSAELTKARTTQAEAQAKAKLIREMIRSGRVNEIPEVASNELVRRISEQRVNVKAQLALEARTLLPGHPRIKELNAQLADLDSELRTAADKAARTLENDARVAGARLESLQGTLDQQKKIVGASSSDEVKMRELDRSARLLKEELEATTTKYQEALARESSKSTPADARIVSRALAPQMASFPKKLPIIGFSTVAALVLSIAAVAARQIITDRPAPRPASAPRLVEPAVAPRPEEETEEAVAAPLVAEPRKRALEAADRSLFAPAQRLAREIVAAAAAEPMLALIACDGEDDRGFALSTARALSREGRTIMVAMDAACRTPVESKAGLADLIAGEASFHEAIHRDPLSRLHVLGAGSAGATEPNGLWLALDALGETYDFVVVAASHRLDVDEAHALSHLAKFVAVFGEYAVSTDRLAAALEQAGLPRPVVVSAEDPVDQTAA